MGDHYVPQFYLQGFASNSRLWAHDRALGKSFLTQPKAIANETNMYPPELEAYLANKIEDPAKEAIAKVRSCVPLSSPERESLAHYLVALWKRVPDARTRVAQRLLGVAASVRTDVLAQIDLLAEADPDFAEAAQERRERVNAVIDLYEKDPPPDIWQQTLKSGATPRMVDGLLAMHWRYLRVDQGMLLASDNPVFFFASVGIGNPASELTISFSSTVALWANRRSDSGPAVARASREAVRELNRRAVHNATRFVFSEADESWILPFHRKGHWTLRRLI
jgi:hypothetical protein